MYLWSLFLLLIIVAGSLLSEFVKFVTNYVIWISCCSMHKGIFWVVFEK